MRSVQSVRWVVAAAVAEALIGLLALRRACLSAMGALGFVGLIVAAFVVMSWYFGLGIEYRFEVTALFLGWLALMISGVLLALSSAVTRSRRELPITRARKAKDSRIARKPTNTNSAFYLFRGEKTHVVHPCGSRLSVV